MPVNWNKNIKKIYSKQIIKQKIIVWTYTVYSTIINLMKWMHKNKLASLLLIPKCSLIKKT